MDKIGGLGPLRYDIEVSSPQVEAGKDLSLFVKVTNPYGIPVIIQDLTTRLPTEFIDRTAQERQRNKKELSEKMAAVLREVIGDKLPDLHEVKEVRKQKFIEFVKEVSIMLPFGSIFSAGYSLAEAVRASSLSPKERILTELDNVLDPCQVERIAEEVGKADKPAEALKRASVALLDEKIKQVDNAALATLQPGDSTVMVFTLRTKHSLLFSPSVYNLHFQVQYQTDGTAHHDAIDYKLSVRASLWAIILGAAIGSTGGYLLKDIFQVNGLMSLVANPTLIKTVEWILKLLGSVLLGMVAVIAFARKKDSQPIFTIEDFWGGLFVGVTAGYMGKSFLDQVLGSSAPPTPTK
ncbi:MAG: hypothetical protein V2B19_17450 [Pseudomonadota bacterium]